VTGPTTGPTTSMAPDMHRIWRATRAPLIIAFVILAVGIGTALLGANEQRPPLDPASFAPDGGHALARLLENQGVRVEPVDRFGAAEQVNRDATVVVTQPDLLGPDRLVALRRAVAQVVLIAPHSQAIAGVLPAVAAGREIGVVNRQPRCSLPAAAAAGTATMGGVSYQARQPAEACYSDSGDATLIQSAGITVLGTPTPLTNGNLGDVGNAALAMRLLGGHRQLVWYVPSPGDPALAGGQRSFYDLLPRGWRFGLIQAAIGVLLLALWRARRLGPLVTEPLPVVVRATETVEGRARLYRGSGAVDHAADTLRHAVVARLVPRLGLSDGAERPAVVQMVAARAGRPAPEIDSLLYGPAPAEESALVRLADELQALENQVNTL
jgi:hypothetical protein